jgi:flavin-dependent dehydrogenase
VQSYAVNLDGKSIPIARPNPERQIVSVYRGGGPRLAQGELTASFDAYLLTQACARGARHLAERVRDVTQGERPVLHTNRGNYPADLVVLATGVNSRSPLAPAFGYRAPRTAIMAQDEILRPPTWPHDQVHVFFRQPPGLTFGALIPKDRYLNISLLGRSLTVDTVNEFISAQALDSMLPDGAVSLCGCTPRIAVGAAQRYYGDRWVAVGDAAVTRLYKDGIGSAFFTAQRAAHTAVHHGISRHDFDKGYAPYCRHVSADNFFGRLLFRVWSITLHTPRFLRAWTSALHQETQWSTDRRIHHRILWGMFTGDEAYRDLFRLAVSPKATWGLVRGWRAVRSSLDIDA